MNAEQTKKSLLLMLTALIWGVAFVAQSVGMNYVGPFTFNAVRSLIGGLVLLPMLPLLDRLRAEAPDRRSARPAMPWFDGCVCGLLLAAASSLQQISLIDTAPGKAGFITALYIVIVPILGVFTKKKPSTLIWISVAVAIVGMYLLCIKEGFSIGRSDLLLMLSALLLSLHILAIDRFAPGADGVRLSMIQFFVCGALCGVPALLFEQPTVHAILSAWMPILYAGALSCGVAYTLQIIGQKNMNPTVASLILSLESVFSALAGWLILGDSLSVRETTGCALVFCSILLAQLPERPRERSKA